MGISKSRLALIETDDRKHGVKVSLAALKLNPVKGKNVLIKPNFNTACMSSNGCGQIRQEIKRGFLPPVYPFSSVHAILKEEFSLLRNNKVSFLICSRLVSISRFLP